MTPLVRTACLLGEQRGRVVMAVTLLVLTIAASVALMGTSAWLISTAALHPSIGALQVAVVGVRFFGISRGVFRYLERVVSHDTAFRLLARLRLKVFVGLVPLVPGRLAFARSGDLLTRLVADVDTLEHALVRVFGPTLAAAVAIAAVAGTLAFFDPWVSVTATAALLLAATAAPWVGWRLGREAGATLVEHRAALAARLVDVVQGVGDLLAFGRDRDQAQRIDATGEALARAQVASARASALGAALVTGLADVAVVAVLALSVPRVSEGELLGVNLAVIALVTFAAFEAVAGLPAAIHGLAATRAAAVRVFAFWGDDELAGREDVGARAGSAAVAVAAKPARGEVHVRVRGLTFGYPGDRAPVLRDVSFDLCPGGATVVVGPSGSGKSTIAHLLMRFWEPPPGAITVDGQDLSEFDPEEWRRQVALMAQDTHIFTGTVEDNLHMAWPGASEAAVAAAVAAASLDRCLARLPDGGRTWIGEQGAQLSEGERQRLAFARAVLRPAPVLVLDEPTASVDPETERVIARGIDELARTRAVLVITHRATGLERAREVLVLHDGVVVERGRYDELVAKGAWLARMAALERDAIAAGEPGGEGSPSDRGHRDG